MQCVGMSFDAYGHRHAGRGPAFCQGTNTVRLGAGASPALGLLQYLSIFQGEGPTPSEQKVRQVRV